ncbi:dual specificity phosphatase, catalytic domain protein [Ostertagia ostertagi]
MVANSDIVLSGSLCGNVVELLPKQLYFASFKVPPHKADPHVRYIDLDNRVHYEPFYGDFGPLNLSVLYRFTRYLHGLVEIIYQGVSADAAYLRLETAQPPKFIGFRDAALGEPTYLLHLHDVLRAVEKAINLKWFDIASFDAEEYELYERVENGDMNWIIPGKILSFCGPHNESRVEDGYPYHSPETYFEYFHATNVTTIVRLNMRMYDAKKFTDAGFDHVDLFFIDGSTPSEKIVENFIRVVDNAKGAVAVHCKAGLGRTGTLIACWMMKEFGLNAAECMAWLRICRPGSVIGPQQDYLVAMQKFCWSMSQNNVVQKARRHNVPDVTAKKSLGKLTSKVDEICLSHPMRAATLGENIVPRPRPNILPLRGRSKKSLDKNGNASTPDDPNSETAIDSLGRSQGDRLLAMKARSQHAPHVSSPSVHTAHLPTLSNGNILHSPAVYMNGRHSGSNKHNAVPSPFPAAQRPSAVAGFSSVSPRFSSPTTPIKPLSTPGSASSISSRSRGIARNLATTMTPAPISRVIVAAGKGAAKKLPSSNKSSSQALRRDYAVHTSNLPLKIKLLIPSRCDSGRNIHHTEFVLELRRHQPPRTTFALVLPTLLRKTLCQMLHSIFQPTPKHLLE